MKVTVQNTSQINYLIAHGIIRWVDGCWCYLTSAKPEVLVRITEFSIYDTSEEQTESAKIFQRRIDKHFTLRTNDTENREDE